MAWPKVVSPLATPCSDSVPERGSYPLRPGSTWLSANISKHFSPQVLPLSLLGALCYKVIPRKSFWREPPAAVLMRRSWLQSFPRVLAAPPYRLLNSLLSDSIAALVGASMNRLSHFSTFLSYSWSLTWATVIGLSCNDLRHSR